MEDKYIWLTEDEEHVAFRHRNARLRWTGIAIRDAVTGKVKALYRDERTPPELLAKSNLIKKKKGGKKNEQR